MLKSCDLNLIDLKHLLVSYRDVLKGLSHFPDQQTLEGQEHMTNPLTLFA